MSSVAVKYGLYPNSDSCKDYRLLIFHTPVCSWEYSVIAPFGLL